MLLSDCVLSACLHVLSTMPLFYYRQRPLVSAERQKAKKTRKQKDPPIVTIMTHPRHAAHFIIPLRGSARKESSKHQPETQNCNLG